MVPMERQLGDIYKKVHRLKGLEHTFKDSLIAMVIIISFPESYVSLCQHLFMKDKNTLTMDFIIRQILMDEKSREAVPHIALKVDQKEKKPAHQSNDNNAKKKNLVCYYCKKKGHFKVNCWKFEADQGINNSANTKKTKESKDKFAKLAVDNQKTYSKPTPEPELSQLLSYQHRQKELVRVSISLVCLLIHISNSLCTYYSALPTK